jgi:hypothetical protein
MNKVDDFRRAAQECRELARSTKDPSTKVALGAMAERWETLAAEREMDIARQQRIRAMRPRA